MVAGVLTMALYVTISINGSPIKTFGAQNITPDTKIGPSTYRICKYVDHGEGSEREYISGVVHHDRKDGAVALAGKVLDFVISMGEGK